MRFVAGRGAVAAEMLLAWAPWLSAIGKLLLAGGAVSAEMLLAGAPWRSAIGNMLLAGAPLSRMLLAEKPHSSIGKQLPLRRSLYNSIGKQQPAVRAQSSIGKH